MINKKVSRKKVFVLMSGGVDSSVAAFLLKKTGQYEVVGCHLVCWRDDCSKYQTEAAYATLNAKTIGIPFCVFDFEKEYREKVFDYMIREYAAGRTPNPDVICNKEIKLGLFLERAIAMGADYVATGHYIRLRRKIPNSRLFIAKDENKDQSYFLWTLTQKQLKHCLFPIGGYLKSEVRKIAKNYDLPSAQKADSQGLCFVGKIHFDEFLGKHLPENPGRALSPSGQILGEHRGLHFYTLGQRQGLKIAAQEPLYVAEKDPKTNTLTLVKEENNLLYKTCVKAGNINWLAGVKPQFPFHCKAGVRYRQEPVSCAIFEKDKNKIEIDFSIPVFAPAAGQSVVFYKDNELLGGAVIE